MGIGGLLPLLKEIQKPSHVREWKGKTVAVDGYVRSLSLSFEPLKQGEGRALTDSKVGSTIGLASSRSVRLCRGARAGETDRQVRLHYLPPFFISFHPR